MKVSSAAAEAETNNGHHTNSPALQQLIEAIEPDAPADGDQAASDTATAVLEAGEDEDGDQEEADDQQAADGNPGEDSRPIPGDEIATETMDAPQEEKKPADPTPEPVSQTTAPNPGTQPSTAASSKADQRPAPAPYDPIAECEEEIAEIGERIVKHSCKISELDAALKAEKKSWKTASDELVTLYLRKADLVLQQKEKAEREAAITPAFTTFVAALQEFAGQQLQDAPAAPAPTDSAAPESTEEFHARIAEQFAPDPATAAADASPTPEQERYDHEFRSLAIDGLEGLTPKILEILHANDVYTVGAFQDWPKKTGCADYTQMSGGNTKLTETRYTKIMDAMMAYMKANPRPSAAVTEVVVATADTTAKSAPASSGTIDIDDI